MNTILISVLEFGAQQWMDRHNIIANMVRKKEHVLENTI
jgi:hypothetical protein